MTAFVSNLKVTAPIQKSYSELYVSNSRSSTANQNIPNTARNKAFTAFGVEGKMFQLSTGSVEPKAMAWNCVRGESVWGLGKSSSLESVQALVTAPSFWSLRSIWTVLPDIGFEFCVYCVKPGVGLGDLCGFLQVQDIPGYL